MIGAAVSARQMQAFLATNNVSLDDLDPNDPQLNWGALDRNTAAPAVAAYARLNRLHADVGVQERLQASGLQSASHIAAIPRSDFVANHAPALGLTTDDAEALHARAADISERALHLWASVHGAVFSAFFRQSRVNPVGADFVQAFERIPSYQDMFGSLNYCECADCQSIFGPAAYFVDLMRLIEAYVTNPNKITGRFSLAGRRPDLAKIPLSCSATNDVVPYLQIVNERLSDALRTDRPGVERDPADAKAVAQASDDDLMRFVAQKWKFPSGLPYNHLLEQVRAVTAQSGVTLESIYRDWGAGEAAAAREALGLSKDEAVMLSQSLATPQDVAPYYGVAAGDLNTLGEVSRLRAATGMTVIELDQLLFQDLTADEIAAKAQANFFINQNAGDRLLNLDPSAPSDQPRIAFLDAPALDRINRFVRLARRLGWDFPTLDWMLRSVAAAGKPAIDDRSFVQLARIRSWSRLFDSTPGELAVLFGPIKTYGAGGPDGVTPFDARFNTADLLARFGRYDPRSPDTWTPATADTAAITRLLPGLGMSLEAVTALARKLWPQSDAKTPVRLDLDSLSALARHGLLRRLFDMPMAAYLRLLTLVGAAVPAKPTGDELAALIGAWQWITSANLDVNELDYACTGVPNAFADPMYDAGRADAWLETVRSIAADVNAERKLVVQLATYFAQDAGGLGPVCAVAAKSLPDGTTWPTLILNATAGSPAVASFLRWVSRWLMLRDRLNLSAATLQAIAARPDAFGFDLRSGALSFRRVAELGRLQAFVQSCHDRNGSILAALLALAGSQLTPAVGDRLADATGWPADQIPTLLAAKWWPGRDTAAAQIMRLADCFGLLRRLGADAGFAQRLAGLADATAGADWDEFKAVASLTVAKISSLYERAQWRAIYDQLHGRFDTRRRDVLLALELDALKRQYPDFETTRDVYELLLIEVEMGPETQISYIKEGLNALQLYLQRARMRLERAVVQLDIPEAWWDWIMSIQTWQANRKIFLYPENYLLPSLRHDKTTLFKTLETDLRQQEVVPAYVETVYKAYLDGFAGLAKLKPIDAYRTRISDPRRGKIDATYLLARDDTDPCSFFICCQEDGYPWGEWKKIDLAINSKYVTPAYAFGRLFLFWIVVKKTTGSAIELVDKGSKSTKSATYVATVQYSFLNNQDKWVQPQTLISDLVVLFETDSVDKVSLLGNELFFGAFDLADITWNKVYVMRLGGENRLGGRARPEDERLVVMFGPMMNSIFDTDTSKPTRQAGLTDAAGALAGQLYVQAQNHKRLIVDRTGGLLPVCSAYIVNGSLEKDSLSPRRELVVFDVYRPYSLAAIDADIVETNGAVRIASSATAVVDSLLPTHGRSEVASVVPTAMTENSFASIAITVAQSKEIFPALKKVGIINANNRVDAGKLAAANLHEALSELLSKSTIHPIQLVEVQKALVGGLRAQQLFGAVAVPRARVTQVGNQPGWFLLDNGDEAFLLQPKVTDRLRKLGKPVFSPLDVSIRLRSPPLHPGSFIMSGIDAAMSAGILRAAVEAGLVDGSFQADEDRVRATDPSTWPQTWLKELTARGLAADRLPLINNVLLNAPIVFPDVFVSDRVDEKTSGTIYGVLPNYNMIDENGRLDTSVLTAGNLNVLLGNLLKDSTITAKQMPGIYRALADTPRLLTATYVNDGDASDYPTLADFKFSLTRVTTGAVGRLERALFTGGLDSLLDLKTQQIPVAPVMPFDRLQPSRTNLEFPKALDVAQVDFDGLYGRYYWEIFFHVPALIAGSFAANQRFQDARHWLHHIFNPTLTEQFVTDDVIVAETDGFIQKALAGSIVGILKAQQVIVVSDTVKAPVLDGDGRVHPKFRPELGLDFLKQASVTDAMVLRVRNILLNYQLSSPTAAPWRFRPFRTQNIETLQEALSDGTAMAVYRSSPFDPFAIASLRIGAFEKAVVMQYVDNLIKWGDMLFAQDNWESITAATMLYIYAYDLLGPRPQNVGPCPTIAPVSYATLREKFGTVPEFLIELEKLVPKSAIPKPAHGLVPVFNDLRTYFCVPENSKFRACWDTVEDRLYKIRHSLNIKGEARQLALFEPALDPLMLAKMASSGSLQRRSDEAAAVPNYRFQFMLDRARNMVSSVTQLGGYLLTALEKRDAEQLALLRSTQDDQVLGLVTRVKQQQIADLEASLAGMRASLEGAQARLGHYQALTAKGLIASEQVHLDAMAVGLAFNMLAGILHTASAIGYAIPQAGSPFAMTYGGVQVGSMVQATAGAAELGSQVSNFIAQRAVTMAGYERRQEDWTLQQATAEHEVGNITQQIAAFEARIAGARQDLAAHLRTIANNRDTFDLLSRKFTNQDLYQWLVDQLSAIYFQSYRLAVDAALAAQKAYQFELDSDATFVAFDYWDSLRKGLAAGEGLRLALDQMEAAYVTNGVRLLEIEKTMSLALLDPKALLDLKTTGKCAFTLDERLFDYDYPGHYARKIKTVSLSVPALLGPYQQIKATLVQVKHAVAVAPRIEAVQYLLDPVKYKKPDTSVLRETSSNAQSIALSRGVDDSGMFQLDFRHERYLAFEGTGAVSSWTLEMPHETNRFDFDQLPDLLITLRYTARSDGTLRTAVESELAKAPYRSGVYLRASQAYGPAWQSFLQNHGTAGKQTLSFRFGVAAMRYLSRVTMTKLMLRIAVADPATPPTSPTMLGLTIERFADVKDRPLKLKDGIAVLDGLTWKQAQFENTWTLTFDVAGMAKDPNVSGLTDGTWIDPARLIEIELIALYNGTIFSAQAA